jgi:hypothetical protein
MANKFTCKTCNGSGRINRIHEGCISRGSIGLPCPDCNQGFVSIGGEHCRDQRIVTGKIAPDALKACKECTDRYRPLDDAELEKMCIDNRLMMPEFSKSIQPNPLLEKIDEGNITFKGQTCKLIPWRDDER